jgi:ADP-heptose:LPS heptosyltransferase
MLMIHQGALGDLILSLPTLATLRRTFPQAESVIMGYPGILQLVEERFYAEKIISVDQRGMASFFVPGGPLDRDLSTLMNTFDLIVVFGKDEKGALIENLKRICPDRILHIHSFPRPGESIHVVDHLLREISRYGISVSEAVPKIYLKESDRIWGSDFWRRKGLTVEERSRLIVIHPGSGSKKKVWPWERFVDLVHYLERHLRLRTVIVLGPAEGTEIQNGLEGMGEGAPILVKGLSLLQVASVIEGCQLFIGNDSGISHLAAALGLPTVALFGPTDPMVWSPRGEKAVVIQKRIDCSPCPREKFFLCRDFECVRAIGIEEVLKGLERIGVRFQS